LSRWTACAAPARPPSEHPLKAALDAVKPHAAFSRARVCAPERRWARAPLRAAQEMNLSHSGLSGQLPGAWGGELSLPALQTLDLSGNGLQGAPPRSCAARSSLRKWSGGWVAAAPPRCAPTLLRCLHLALGTRVAGSRLCMRPCLLAHSSRRSPPPAMRARSGRGGAAGGRAALPRALDGAGVAAA